MSLPAGMEQSVRNLLINCAQLQPDDRLLMVHEPPDLGWYDAAVVSAVEAGAREIGCETDVLTACAPDTDQPHISRAAHNYDCTIYLARIGDQDRFAPARDGRRTVMVYSRDAASFASSFGRTDHRAMQAFKLAMDATLANAGEISIECPAGTNLTGQPTGCFRQAAQDVSVRRFPLGVPAPMPAALFSGTVAVSNYLTPTGSRPYHPACLALPATVFAEVDAGQIVNFTGPPALVEQVRQHYARVAEQFGIDRDVVHSWHAGIHPGCFYAGNAADDPDRWSNTVFPNPRLLHFHTCGAYAPGEICWTVLDPTISIDGVALWDKGRLHAERFAQLSQCIVEWRELQALFDNPDPRVGIQSPNADTKLRANGTHR